MKISNQNQQKKTDVEAEGLLGSVKQIKQICYKARSESGMTVEGKIDDSVEHFSKSYTEKGIIAEEQIFNVSSYLNKKNIYNEQGLLAEEITGWNDNGLPYSRTTRMYDVQGNETELAQYNNAGGLNYKIIHQYDANGNLLEEISMDGQGNIT
ncbi:MAG TPA: hypothetical protein VF411_05675, partial [Bacteroidia bacterium]